MAISLTPAAADRVKTFIAVRGEGWGFVWAYEDRLLRLCLRGQLRR